MKNTKSKSLEKYKTFIKGNDSKAPAYYLNVSEGKTSGWIDPHEYYGKNSIPNKTIINLDQGNDMLENYNNLISIDDYKDIKAKVLKLEIKPTYGRRRIVPLCEKSKILAKLCRIDSFRDGIGKTIPYEAIPMIEKLGYIIEWFGLNDEDKKKLENMK